MSEIKVFTMPQVAKMCSINRTTLKRLEDRGVVPLARWVTRPFRARVYTEEEAEVVKARVKAYFQRYVRGQGDGFITVEEEAIVDGEVIRAENDE